MSRLSKKFVLLALLIIAALDLSLYKHTKYELSTPFTSNRERVKELNETAYADGEDWTVKEIATDTEDRKDTAEKEVDSRPLIPVEHYYESHLPPKETERREAISEIIQTILKYEPNITALNKYNGHPPTQMYNGRPNPVFTQDYLNKFLKVNAGEFKELRKQHEGFVEEMASVFSPEFQESRMHYSGDGILYVGGHGSFNWLTLLSVRHVRHLGSVLPIEVVLPLHKDAEPGYCEMLATMNATCVILEDFVDEQVKGFQLKGLALLVSSFERLLLLDSDNIPAHNPDRLFTEGPFTKHGLIVWPDYWRRATHPVYYDIANITLGTERVSFGENGRERGDEIIPVHDLEGGITNPSSESGQLLLNKKSNWYTTLLSTYYNFYGPNHYYPIFSQGTLGQGDKETFLSAAVAMHETFYQVKRFVIPFGHFNRNGDFRGGAIGQFDPIQDEIHQMDRKNTKGPSVMFVHSNTPKLNPLSLKNSKELVEQDQRKRLYGTGMRQSIGYDFEWTIWEHMRVLICEMRVQMAAWNEHTVDEMCQEVREQCVHLEKSSKNNEGLLRA